METTFNELKQLVERWAEDKGILEKGTPEKQALKTLEECGELLIAIGRNDKEEVADAIGDVIVTLIIQAKMQDLDIVNCLNFAYKTIANREGKMVNGQFIKSE